MDSWHCLRSMVGAWEARCGALGDYVMQHTRLMANLCNAGLGVDALLDAVHGDVCSEGALLA